MESLRCLLAFLIVVSGLSNVDTWNICDVNKPLMSENASLQDVVLAIVNETLSLPKMGHIVHISAIEKSTKSNTASPDKMMYTLYTSLSNTARTIEQRKRQFTIHLKNIPGRYAETVSNINYFLECFKLLGLKKRANRLKQADRVLHIERGVHKWLFRLNHMLVGQYLFSGELQQPVLFNIIDDISMKIGCSDDYKRTLDTVWQEMLLLQCQGFLLWAHALHIQGKKLGFMVQYYKKTLCNQLNKLKEDTCELTVKDSINVNCTGGLYSHRDAKFLPRCKANYYLSMEQIRPYITCRDRNVECLPCDCSPYGSTSTECQDGTGQCYCSKNHYQGKNCRDRDCHWTSWSTWGNCSISCGYGVKKRGRVHAIHQERNGKACEGDYYETETCFSECCDTEFNCKSSQKCIPQNSVCDAVKDCTYAEDERNCSRCSTLSNKNLLRAGGALYWQNMRCMSSQAINSFKFLYSVSNATSNLDFIYSCCQLKKDVCIPKSYRKTLSNQEDYIGLYKYPVHCRNKGMLQMLYTSRAIKSTRRYTICCELKEEFRKKAICYIDHSPYAEIGKRIVSTFPGQGLKCKNGHYLSMFKIIYDKSKRNWAFLYRCCNVLY